MNKRRTFFLCAIFIIVVTSCFTSCTKEADPPITEENPVTPPPPPPPPPALPPGDTISRIKIIYTIKDGDTSRTYYYYDSLQRISLKIDSSLTVKKSAYAYSPEIIHVTENDSITYFYVTDSKGMILQAGLAPVFWQYDSSGYLIEREINYPHSNPRTYTYYYSNFNNDSIKYLEVSYYSPDKIRYTTVKEYYPFTNTIGNENTGERFWGKQNRHLVKKIATHNYPLGDTETLYTYEADSLNRVTKETATKSGAEISVRLFWYY